jgi:hypothetical protein
MLYGDGDGDGDGDSGCDGGTPGIPSFDATDGGAEASHTLLLLLLPIVTTNEPSCLAVTCSAGCESDRAASSASKSADDKHRIPENVLEDIFENVQIGPT